MKINLRVQGFPTVPFNSPFNSKTLMDELDLMNRNPTIESYTYGFTNTLLSSIFKPEGGYIIVTQSKETEGEPDFIIKRYGRVIAIVESKALKGKYS